MAIEEADLAEIEHKLDEEEAAKLDALIGLRSSLSSFRAGYEAAMRDVDAITEQQIRVLATSAGKRMKVDQKSMIFDASTKAFRERNGVNGVAP